MLVHTKWQDLKIELVSENSDYFFAIYKQYKFIHHRKDMKYHITDRVWFLMVTLCKNKGRLYFENKLHESAKHSKKVLCNNLKKMFHRKDDPIIFNKEKNGYECVFQLDFTKSYNDKVKYFDELVS